MKKLFLFAALFVAAATFSSCEQNDDGIDDIAMPDLPDKLPQKLAITFAEGNSLEFNIGETKTVHYTITGGSENTVVTAEMQTADDAYTVKTTSTSTAKGTIAITAKMPETENCVVVTVSDGDRSITAKIAVSTNPIPEELAITFAEGNSLQFDVDETKAVHYTITGGSDKTVVTAELQNLDDAYALKTTPASATEGTIAITAKTPETENCVIVTVSDGSQSVTAEIAVSTNPIPEELAITFAEGNSLEFNINETKTVHYTITGGSDKTVVTAKLQTPDDAYTIETTPTSATEGTIAITAKIPETENCVIVTVSDGSQTVTAEIAVSTKPVPEELAITFTEGNSLELGVNETKTIHYTITGGSENTVVTAEMQTPDDAYTVETTPTSATEGTIAITAKTPTANNVLVTVSNGDRSVTASIDVAVTLKASFDGKTVVVVTPGTLSRLLADYDTDKITELTIIGNLNSWDITTLKNLPNLAVLDMENVNLEELPAEAFYPKTSLTSVKLPKTLKTIGDRAFCYCRSLTSVTIGDSVTTIGNDAFSYCGLTSVTIPDNVTEIGDEAFYNCRSLTSVTIGNSVTSIGNHAFWWCSGLSAFYGKFASSDNRCLIIDGCLVAFAPAGLTSYTIPDSVTEIRYNTFQDCNSLAIVTISNKVTSIGQAAFGFCENLVIVTIGNSMRTIARDAFAGCSGLTSFCCKTKTPPSVGSGSAFYNVSATLYVPIGCKEAYATANVWRDFTKIVETQF